MKITTKIFFAFLFILVLFAFTTFTYYQFTQDVNTNTVWLRNSQEVIRSSSRLHRNMINMESALNAYAFTQEESSFGIYESNRKENELLFREIAATVSVKQKVILREIKDAYNTWRRTYAAPLIDDVNKPDSYKHLTENSQKFKEHNKNGKLLLMKVRDLFKTFNDNEYDVRDQRRRELDESVRRTKGLSILLMSLSVLTAFLAVAYITRVISKRISSMVALSESLSEGKFSAAIDDQENDELSPVIRSLNTMAGKLEDTIKKLERQNQELDRFAYVVSHDLKAPLIAIDNLSRWIDEDMQEDLPEEIRHFLLMMRGRVNRMQNLIEGILEFARVGKTENQVEEVDVHALVKKVISTIAPREGIVLRVQDDLPVVSGEKVYLEQIFSNLINNAVMHHDGEEGLVFVSFTEQTDHYEFSVSDDGPGIDPQFHQKIFQIFQTLQERDSFESTGVGLAIVKKILDDKNCFIKVASQTGTGATFTFSWPKVEG